MIFSTQQETRRFLIGTPFKTFGVWFNSDRDSASEIGKFGLEAVYRKPSNSNGSLPWDQSQSDLGTFIAKEPGLRQPVVDNMKEVARKLEDMSAILQEGLAQNKNDPRYQALADRFDAYLKMHKGAAELYNEKMQALIRETSEGLANYRILSERFNAKQDELSELRQEFKGLKKELFKAQQSAALLGEINDKLARDVEVRTETRDTLSSDIKEVNRSVLKLQSGIKGLSAENYKAFNQTQEAMNDFMTKGTQLIDSVKARQSSDAEANATLITKTSESFEKLADDLGTTLTKIGTNNGKEISALTSKVKLDLGEMKDGFFVSLKDLLKDNKLDVENSKQTTRDYLDQVVTNFQGHANVMVQAFTDEIADAAADRAKSENETAKRVRELYEKLTDLLGNGNKNYTKASIDQVANAIAELPDNQAAALAGKFTDVVDSIKKGGKDTAAAVSSLQTAVLDQNKKLLLRSDANFKTLTESFSKTLDSQVKEIKKGNEINADNIKQQGKTLQTITALQEKVTKVIDQNSDLYNKLDTRTKAQAEHIQEQLKQYEAWVTRSQGILQSEFSKQSDAVTQNLEEIVATQSSLATQTAEAIRTLVTNNALRADAVSDVMKALAKRSDEVEAASALREAKFGELTSKLVQEMGRQFSNLSAQAQTTHTAPIDQATTDFQTGVDPQGYFDGSRGAPDPRTYEEGEISSHAMQNMRQNMATLWKQIIMGKNRKKTFGPPYVDFLAGQQPSQRVKDLLGKNRELITKGRESASRVKIEFDKELPWQRNINGGWFDDDYQRLKFRINWLRIQLGLVTLKWSTEWILWHDYIWPHGTTRQFISSRINKWKAKRLRGGSSFLAESHSTMDPMDVAFLNQLVLLENEKALIDKEKRFVKRMMQWAMGNGPDKEYELCWWVPDADVDKTSFFSSWKAYSQPLIKEREAKKTFYKAYLIENNPDIMSGMLTKENDYKKLKEEFLKTLHRTIPKNDEEIYLYYKYIVKKNGVFKLEKASAVMDSATKAYPKVRKDIADQITENWLDDPATVRNFSPVYQVSEQNVHAFIHHNLTGDPSDKFFEVQEAAAQNKPPPFKPPVPAPDLVEFVDTTTPADTDMLDFDQESIEAQEQPVTQEEIDNYFPYVPVDTDWEEEFGADDEDIIVNPNPETESDVARSLRLDEEAEERRRDAARFARLQLEKEEAEDRANNFGGVDPKVSNNNNIQKPDERLGPVNDPYYQEGYDHAFVDILQSDGYSDLTRNAGYDEEAWQALSQETKEQEADRIATNYAVAFARNNHKRDVLSGEELTPQEKWERSLLLEK